jgi:hypothetical protein
MIIQLTQVTNTGDKRGAGGTYILAGDPRNFKGYHHVVCCVSAANLRSLFVKIRPKAYPQNPLQITFSQGYDFGFVLYRLSLGRIFEKALGFIFKKEYPKTF